MQIRPGNENKVFSSNKRNDRYIQRKRGIPVETVSIYPASLELLPRNCTCTFVTEHYLLLLEQGSWMKRSLVRHVGVDFEGRKDHDQLNAGPGIFYSYKGKL
ncbi:hypothetical protein NPIL_90291 [Nephila pilipes]|uniref:Uncharacterized protein n=1 Tax=Nephila pilipes TaxID=299642 RepID=A0A8X6PX84_NEPPI|nr:hypothetical protein NPIL_90291 [Nephila pilipes]